MIRDRLLRENARIESNLLAPLASDHQLQDLLGARRAEYMGFRMTLMLSENPGAAEAHGINRFRHSRVTGPSRSAQPVSKLRSLHIRRIDK